MRQCPFFWRFGRLSVMTGNDISLITAYPAAAGRICKFYPPLNPLLGRGLRSQSSEGADWIAIPFFSTAIRQCPFFVVWFCVRCGYNGEVTLLRTANLAASSRICKFYPPPTPALGRGFGRLRSEGCREASPFFIPFIRVESAVRFCFLRKNPLNL